MCAKNGAMIIKTWCNDEKDKNKKTDRRFVDKGMKVSMHALLRNSDASRSVDDTITRDWVFIIYETKSKRQLTVLQKSEKGRITLGKKVGRKNE